MKKAYYLSHWDHRFFFSLAFFNLENSSFTRFFKTTILNSSRLNFSRKIKLLAKILVFTYCFSPFNYSHTNWSFLAYKILAHLIHFLISHVYLMRSTAELFKKHNFCNTIFKNTRVVSLALVTFTRRVFHSHISKVWQKARFLLAFFRFFLAFLFLALFFPRFFPSHARKKRICEEPMIETNKNLRLSPLPRKCLKTRKNLAFFLLRTKN